MTKVKIGILALALFSASGCSFVKQAEFDALKMEVARNKEISERALNRAHDAEEVAQNATARSERTEEAFNRAFKKKMYK